MWVGIGILSKHQSLYPDHPCKERKKTKEVILHRLSIWSSWFSLYSRLQVLQQASWTVETTIYCVQCAQPANTKYMLLHEWKCNIVHVWLIDIPEGNAYAYINIRGQNNTNQNTIWAIYKLHKYKISNMHPVLVGVLFNVLLWTGRNGLPPTPDTLHLRYSYHLHSSHRFLSTWGVVSIINGMVSSAIWCVVSIINSMVPSAIWG